MTEPTDREESLDRDHDAAQDAFESRLHTAADIRNEQHREAGDSKPVSSPVVTKTKEAFDHAIHGNDGVIDVHFDGTSWCIEDESLDKPLQFSHLADAEARASELSKDTGRGVCVHGQDGDLIDSFK